MRNLRRQRNAYVTNVRWPVPDLEHLANIRTKVRKNCILLLPFLQRSTRLLPMESASSEHQSEQPPGYMSNLIGLVIAAITIALPLYAISNFNAAQAIPSQQSSSLSLKAAKPVTR